MGKSTNPGSRASALVIPDSRCPACPALPHWTNVCLPATQALLRDALPAGMIYAALSKQTEVHHLSTEPTPSLLSTKASRAVSQLAEYWLFSWGTPGLPLSDLSCPTHTINFSFPTVAASPPSRTTTSHSSIWFLLSLRQRGAGNSRQGQHPKEQLQEKGELSLPPY